MKSIYSNTITGIIHILSAAAIYLLLNTGCDLLESNKSSNNLQLTVSETSCTEAWLSLKTNQLSLPQEISLIQNEKERETFNLTKRDTLLYLDSLQPNKSYKFKVKPRQGTVTSQTVIANTMDTTSHNFSWETFTFGGQGGSSVLNDVAIINENNIWAVGEIYTADSTGAGTEKYNAVHWDGESWELEKINFYFSCYNTSGTKIAYPANSIFKLENNELLITAAVQVAFIDAEGNKKLICNPYWFTINTIWGTSSEDFYIAGDDGNIAHYDGGSWEKIETNSSGIGKTDIDKITGAKNIITDKTEFYISAPPMNYIFRPEEQIKWTQLNKIDNRFGRCIWSEGGLKFYTCGNGIVKGVSGSWEIEYERNDILYTHITGDAKNNIIAVGVEGEISLFNGIRWKRYLELRNNSTFYQSANIKNDMVIAVGETYNNNVSNYSAMIIVGRR